MANMVYCKSCGKEIAKSAKTCPNCGEKNKKPFYKAVWFWVIIVLIFIGIAAGGGNENDSSSSSNSNMNSQENKPIEYQIVDIDELESALKDNAAAAKDKYNGKYLEITGRLGTIDSDLKYISLLSTTDKWDIVGVHCVIKKSSTKDVIKTLKSDQTIVVKGKITDVGEVLGYYLDIDEVVAK